METNTFTVFGDGSDGRKTDDLKDHSALIESLGLYIPKSFSIATDIFNSVIAPKLELYKESEQLQNFICPPELRAINEELLKQFEPEQAYAVRSSALAESGGIGIYKTTFFWVTGKRAVDLRNLWKCERLVYASELSRDAELWRQKTQMPAGMAILIQPVVGKKWGRFFFPSLSGLAYSSYGGKPTVRAVVGLGTKAVSGDGFLYYQAPKQREFFDHCRQRKWGDAVKSTLASAYATAGFKTDRSGLQRELEADFSAFASLFPRLEELKKEGNFYLEWAIKDGKIYVVQFSPYEEKIPEYLSFNSSGHELLFSGGDLIEGNEELYSGKASCKLMIYVRSWTKETAMVMHYFNRLTKDYLLIIPDEALSSLADINNNPLKYSHFSQAAAVVEKQKDISLGNRLTLMENTGKVLPNHTNNTGASHFSELCERSDILFFGGEFSESFLNKMPPADEIKAQKDVLIWLIPTEVIVNKSAGLGQVFIPKELKSSFIYQPNMLRNWADMLRRLAMYYEMLDRDLSNVLYDVAYNIIPDCDIAKFDPFKVEDEVLNNKDELLRLTKSFDILCEKQKTGGPVNLTTWEDKLENYINEFRIRLESLIEIN